MAPQPASDEADIRQRIDALIEAVRAFDLEGVEASYAPDVVSFDMEPPLQHVGAEAKVSNWRSLFTFFQRPVSYELQDLTIAVGGDVLSHIASIGSAPR